MSRKDSNRTMDPPPFRPFQQGAFANLPEKPRVPHDFFTLPMERVSLPLADLGPAHWVFRKIGVGPPLLLIHGLMTTGYSWRYVVAALARHRTVYIPDLPGSGGSEAPPGELRPQRMAHALARFMESQGQGPMEVIGNSMGGYLSAYLAFHRPDLVKRLIIVHAPGFPEARLGLLWAATRLPGAESVLGAIVGLDPLRWAHRNVHYYDESLKSLEEAREYGLPLLTPAGRSGFLRQLRDMMNFREMAPFHAELRRSGGLSMPSLLLYVRADPMVPPWMGSAWQALLPGAKLQWMEEGSHFLHVDRPELFLNACLPFLQASGPN